MDVPATVVDCFSGIGLLGLAVRRVFSGARTLVYVENEATAALRLAARMESGHLDPAPVWGDVKTFPAELFRGRVDMVVGGFPCTDLSLAGKRAGIRAERSGLFFDLIRAVRDVRPRLLFLENVAAIAVGRELDAVYGALAEIGFDALGASLRAADVGAPHGRDRWWCLAWDRELLAHGLRDVESGRHRQDRSGRGVRSVRDALVAVGLADATGSGRGAAVGTADMWQPDPARISTIMANPEIGRQECLPRRGSERRAVAARSGAGSDTAVVLAPGVGRREGRAEPVLDGRGHPVTCAGNGVVVNPGGAGLPHIEHGRVSGAPQGQRETHAAALESGIPCWPPGPDDRDSWAYVLERWPHLAPAVVGPVRRVADGGAVGMELCVCARTDRLRGLGNAVVPAQAEAALRLLWFRAFGELLP